MSAKGEDLSSRKWILGLVGILALGLGIKKVRIRAAKNIVSRSQNQVGSRQSKKEVNSHERA